MSWGYEVGDGATSTPSKACTILAAAAETARTSDVEPAVRGFFAHLHEVAAASAAALSACGVVYQVSDDDASGRVAGAASGPRAR